MSNAAKFQIGKNGVTDGVIESLELILKNHRQIRISVLKSSGKDRENIESFEKPLQPSKLSKKDFDNYEEFEGKSKSSIEKIALEIQKELKTKCDFRIIGFTIILTKSSRKSI